MVMATSFIIRSTTTGVKVHVSLQLPAIDIWRGISYRAAHQAWERDNSTSQHRL